MKTPFPYFGAKRRVAPHIWRRFGDPSYYYEPFCGALGTLLNRPKGSAERLQYEYVGDADCQIANFFRAAKLANSEELAHFADWPASQLDLEARASWLKAQRRRLAENLKADPNWYDIKCAAWFAWNQSVKISTNGSYLVLRRTCGVRRRRQGLAEYFATLAQRLKDVTIHFGDWAKLANAAEMESERSEVAILLDPPYAYDTGRKKGLYLTDSGDVAQYVRQWAVAVATYRPKLKIALCGYSGEHKMPSDWEEVTWPSKLGKGRERIWFSPSCSSSANDGSAIPAPRLPKSPRPNRRRLTPSDDKSRDEDSMDVDALDTRPIRCV
jgi:DNA adenine methylase